MAGGAWLGALSDRQNAKEKLQNPEKLQTPSSKLAAAGRVNGSGARCLEIFALRKTSFVEVWILNCEVFLDFGF
jgi:hypothetical protein